ncbi:MAG: hypothetical protein A2509_08745 [Candidatus Edwardsbacteria bacterium RIFOXYD12_FULL_50_11]|uniref:Uncharacterized protein n=1 Tax=Candidatus Edwardsbacteria bacterium GWF2_54_11 TaxID=1817851 RepID=A0A1F5RER2_9BACT|nr:MAG: hypothetical protein A2502_02115 [Candidatus Edwardsbacteria bacterium RifOxyC12_full_54_24]OGF09058.1 MAG: hypothetical protein A2273_10570 [Candidatus Edwardsbacteria bacterium RifOxyA12_full_54_48]OGF12417.1 MAG: hypothetical protein A3K15_01025 [Candidatus Edwardsbacteria bacterium GWE2_54_12]OGF12945.1 MAG: hypothetical protein A2024_12025 [Candidatus Edwardsbacteria bacterium GWF2_54_11]OGF17479.1 MAG: hypothetical protein A2509_08745 [Candidatus Edwardsbacteria bacterium RIFOXYD1
MGHEEQFIRAFIIKEKKERYLTLLQTQKGRHKITRRLAHSSDIDNKCIRLIPNHEQTPNKIYKILKQRNAPEICHVISEDVKIDNKDLPLEEALVNIIGKGSGTILSCIPGQLGYYEGEDQNERYIISLK